MIIFKYLRSIGLAALALVALSTPVSRVDAAAAAPASPAPFASFRPEGPTSAAELESFLDGIIQPQLQEGRFAGVTLSVVRDGQALLAKGYGYADVARAIPVCPEATIFQIGSTTKLFTWTAVMQLAEQGQLNLDADINTYLDFKIPATYPEPITLRHLMGHTAGFEDISLGMFPYRLEQVQPLGKALATQIPARVRPPGQISAYSNYGADLAGYIVERVSGLPYEQYVEKNIFQPLGMTQTTARQPSPPALAPDVSLGYTSVNEVFEPQPVQWLRTQPSGAISSTAMDMAHFMIAHLQNGRFGEARILQEQTAEKMHSTLFRMDGRVSGFAYGFFERDMNGQRVIGHAGSTLVFNSDLILLPNDNLGLFVSSNTYGTDVLIEEFITAFMDHYYPVAQEASTPPISSGLPPASFAGSYRLTRASYTSFEKIKGLLLTLDVTAASDGTLLLTAPLTTLQLRLAPAAPLLFREDTSGLPVAFRRDTSGSITHFLIGNRPDQTYEKVAWFETPSFHIGLLLVCSILFLTVPVAALGGWLITRRKRAGTVQPSAPARGGRWLLGIVAALYLLALANFIQAFFINFETTARAVTGGDLSGVNLLLLLWLVPAILTVGTVVFAILAWKNRYWSTIARVHYTLVTLAALAIVWFLNYWNLLGWRV